MDLLKEDNRDALEITVKAVKVHMQQTWADMANAQVDVTMLTVRDSSCMIFKGVPRMTTNYDFRS